MGISNMLDDVVDIEYQDLYILESKGYLSLWPYRLFIVSFLKILTTIKYTDGQRRLLGFI